MIGVSMSLKINNGEQASIDLLLDRAMVADQTSMSISSSIDSSESSATTAVQQLLGLLSTMPAADPAADLVARTMAFIDRSVTQVHPTASASESASSPLLDTLAGHPLQ